MAEDLSTISSNEVESIACFKTILLMKSAHFKFAVQSKGLCNLPPEAGRFRLIRYSCPVLGMPILCDVKHEPFPILNGSFVP